MADGRRVIFARREVDVPARPGGCLVANAGYDKVDHMNGEQHHLQPGAQHEGFGQAAEIAEMAADNQPEAGASVTELKVTSMAEILSHRLQAAEAKLAEIQSRYPDAEFGKQNFRDITVNLLTGAKANLRYVGEPLDPEDEADGYNPAEQCSGCLTTLEQYLWALNQPGVLDAEMSGESGYYPDLRQEMNEKHQKDGGFDEIQNYVDGLVAGLQAEREESRPQAA